MKFSRVAAISALVFSTAASAVPITVVGSGFDLQYDSALVGLFGSPVLVGNQLSWFPSGSPGFTAQSQAGFGVTRSTFALRISAQPGFEFTGFSLAESGSYSYFGSGALVSVSGQLTVTPLPGSALSDPVTASTVFAPNALFDFGLRNWSAEAGAVVVPAGTADVNVTVQNILAAFVPPGGLGYSSIEKTSAVLSIGVMAAVPEPETYAMLLSGLGLVGFLALRRRQRD